MKRSSEDLELEISGRFFLWHACAFCDLVDVLCGCTYTDRLEWKRKNDFLWLINEIQFNFDLYEILFVKYYEGKILRR